MNFLSRLRDWAQQFSFVGLAVAAFFFALSVTPSLLPRPYFVQGVLSGIALAVGYGLGVAGVMLYHFLQFRDPSNETQAVAKRTTSAVVAIVIVAYLWRMTGWQNSIRERMEMPALETSYPLRMLLIALAVGIALVVAWRIIIYCGRVVAQRLNRLMPPRVSLLVSSIAMGIFLLLVGEGIVARVLLSAADSLFLHLDGIVDDGVAQPTNRLASGSIESLVAWDTIGRYGKDFIVQGPKREEIAELLDREPLEPLRIYVGLKSRDTPGERAALALAELKRVGGFQRSNLIIATPTGTGWLDPSGVDPVEYLLGGDTAIVSMQYSYLPSWLTILVDPRRSIESADALFNAVYDHWCTLPRDARPRLYLHGLSLGSLGSEASVDLVTLLEDPIQGAVFSGPPFPSRQWSKITADRNRDSPQWLPRYRKGRLVRFMNQFEELDPAQPWGPMRFVYIQHASDPMVFFSPSMLFREPAWMQGDRGRDVSPAIQWKPIVTFLQLAFDLPMATSVPLGFGHNYAPADYIDAWVAVTDPPLSAERVNLLKDRFRPNP